MIKGLKEFFEKVAYAGLKPQGGRAVTPANAKLESDGSKPKGFAALQLWIESKLNTSANADPLYLSNRTPAQRFRTFAIIGLPVLLVLGGVSLALFGFFNPAAVITPPPQGLSNAEIAAKMLPDLEKNIHVDSQSALEIQDVHVVSGYPLRLAGVARNNSDHDISRADLTFDLTDKTGSRQGAVSTEIKNIASKATMPFQFPIEQSTATFALVRDVAVR